MATAPGVRGRGRPGYDRESLLRDAVAVFSERGYDGTSMEDLAGRLGITKSAIYHHVRSRDELLRMGVDRAVDALSAVFAEPAATQGPAVDRLWHVLRRAVEVLVDELPFVTLLLRVRGNSEVERRALDRRRELDHRVVELVVAAKREGSIRADVEPELVSRLLFGMVNSVSEWYRPGGAWSREQVAETLTALTFDGLRVLAGSGHDPSRAGRTRT